MIKNNLIIKYYKLIIFCASPLIIWALFPLIDYNLALNNEITPSHRWIFDSNTVIGYRINDNLGQFHGEQIGFPVVKHSEFLSYCEFHGKDGFMLKDNLAGNETGMPKEKFTVISWVRIDNPSEKGCIIGCIKQENSINGGWCLGYENEKFIFTLNSLKPKSENEPSVVHSNTIIKQGKWYCVTASYDGKEMKLFINSILEGQTYDQNGFIRYADETPFIIGRCYSRNKSYGLCGAIRDIQIYNTSISNYQITNVYKNNNNIVKIKPEVAPPYFIISPYLQYPTDNSITIMWETSKKTTSIVRYGMHNPLDNYKINNNNETQHKVVIDNLKQNSSYFYQIECKSENGGVLQTCLIAFKTVPSFETPFSFSIIGDTQNANLTEKIMKLIISQRPQFIIHVGDWVENSDLKMELIENLFSRSINVLSNVPIMPALGNHENKLVDFNTNVWMPYKHVNEYFIFPNQKYYYNYRYGNSDFYVLNSFQSLKPGSEQYMWFENALKESHGTWKIVYNHIPIYSSAGNEQGDVTWNESDYPIKINVQNIIPLLEKYNVDIYFNGHIHGYERTHPIRNGKVEKNGVVYITTGCADISLDSFSPFSNWFKSEIRSTSNYSKINIYGSNLNYKAYDSEGRLIDCMDLEK